MTLLLFCSTVDETFTNFIFVNRLNIHQILLLNSRPISKAEKEIENSRRSSPIKHVSKPSRERPSTAPPKPKPAAVHVSSTYASLFINDTPFNSRIPSIVLWIAKFLPKFVYRFISSMISLVLLSGFLIHFCLIKLIFIKFLLYYILVAILCLQALVSIFTA